MIIVQGTVTADPAAIAELGDALKTMMTETRGEAGCLHYSLAVEDAAAGIISISERWADDAALKAHFTAPHMASFNARLKGKVHGMDIKLYDASGERGVG